MERENKEGAVPKSPWLKVAWIVIAVLISLAMLAELLVGLL